MNALNDVLIELLYSEIKTISDTSSSGKPSSAKNANVVVAKNTRLNM